MASIGSSGAPRKLTSSSSSSGAVTSSGALAAASAAVAAASAGRAAGGSRDKSSADLATRPRSAPMQRVPSARQGPWPAPSTFQRLQDISQAHVQSFNFMLDAGLPAAVADIPAREVTVASGDTLQFWIESAEIGFPTKADHKDAVVADKRLMPTECRERGLTYSAPLTASLCRRVNGGPVERMSARLGDVPIMVRSSRCHLFGMGPKELVGSGEEAVEFGGYFICNGNERIVRMLQIPRRNHPMAINRSAYTNRGPLYSDKGVVMRSVREADNTGVTVTLHYLTDGSATLRFAVNRQEFFLPVILVLKALVPCTDKEIYERVLAGDAANVYLSDRILLLLRDAKRYEAAIHSREAALAYLGARFRGILDGMAPSLTDAQAGQALLDRYVLVHLPGGGAGARDKFNMLILMLRKLYLFVRGDVLEDSPDSLANQELLLTGHLVLMFLKEKLGELLSGAEEMIRREDAIAARHKAAAANAVGGSASGRGGSGAVQPPALADAAYFRKVIDRQPLIGRKLNYLLATGNLVTQTGLDLMQVSGFSVVADKINFMRFTTHFRSVHRGAFFAEQKTTTVRKLLPENWGFLCPVHTPDGAPCGLLNHISAPASIVAHPLNETAYAEAVTAVKAAAAARAGRAGAGAGAGSADAAAAGGGLVSTSTHLPTALHAFLLAQGMTPHAALNTVLPADQLPVMLDGRLLGGAPPHTAYAIAAALRREKALTSGLVAGVERMAHASSDGAGAGAGGSPLEGPNGQVPGQTEAIHELVRAAVQGRTRVDTMGLAGISRSRSAAAGASGASAAGSEGGGAAATGLATAAALEAARAAGLAVPALPLPSIVLPASMEVAFIPPPWWDAESDPAVAAAMSAAPTAGVESGSGAGAGAGSSSALARASGGKAADGEDGGAGGGKVVGLFPGLFLSTTQARLVRPVLQLDTGLVELLSPLEQPYLDVACTPEDVEEILGLPLGGGGGSSDEAGGLVAGNRCLYTHIELSPVAMLSEVAQLTPFSDLNQSPRNMYQCQMGKQTMGTPVHSWERRTDTKMFRLQNPQAPIVQTAAQREWGMDEYPAGANAVVAVIAYTGYDMEDACIVNKSSYERGFGHASVYKTHSFDLTEHKTSADAGRFIFHNTYLRGEAPYKFSVSGTGGEGAAGLRKEDGRRPQVGERIAPNLDEDGLPPVGTLLRYGDPIYAVLDTTEGTHKLARHKELEPAYVDEVRILGMGGGSAHSGAAAGTPGIQTVSIKLRINRNPVVGDKFSSRHGQKGVLSFLWPQADMPFSASGMSPDVIINPHAFPSRMTIGMLIESMAGKAGALHGTFQDATPFRFNEKHRVVDYFGTQLRAAGYAYYGTEPLYSGVTGEPLHCDIYIGCVYYQRLRHMVSDKSQVRATGPINQLTRQPVKGRKKHGGIRFGEMERDSLLAHGASFLLHDRLHNSSDRHLALVCRRCGSMLSTYSLPAAASVLSLPGDPDAPLAATGGLVPVQTNPGSGVTTTLLNFSGAAAMAAGGGAAPAGTVPVINRAQRVPMCRNCGTGAHVAPVAMPYVMRYLANELAAMNIKIELALGPGPYGVK